MHLRQLALALLLPVFSLTLACDGGDKAKADADAKAKAKADEDAAKKEKADKRRKEYEDKLAAEEAEKVAIAAKIVEISTIPEGTTMPKKIADACELVVTAQSDMMKRLYPEVAEDALTTQLGMLRKQCLEGTSIEVVMCQKFALEATDEQLKSMINEYLPACMTKYPAPAAP